MISHIYLSIFARVHCINVLGFIRRLRLRLLVESSATRTLSALDQ